MMINDSNTWSSVNTDSRDIPSETLCECFRVHDLLKCLKSCFKSMISSEAHELMTEDRFELEITLRGFIDLYNE